MKTAIFVAIYLMMTSLFGAWSDAMDRKYKEESTFASTLGFSLLWPIMLPMALGTLAWCDGCRWQRNGRS